MKVKFTQFFDVASSAENFQVFKIKAGGEIVKQRCLPQFVAFNKYKLGSISVKMVPASTLPVDPTGLSYETGETTVDPRDMFNPGLVRITNGEPVANIGDMNNYYATLLDPRWFKFQLQQGFSRYAKPLVFNIGEISQDSSPFFGDVNDTVNMNTYLGHVNGTVSTGDAVHVYDDSDSIDVDNIFSHAPIQTGKIKLGWLPTNTRGNSASFTSESSFYGTLSRVPEVYVWYDEKGNAGKSWLCGHLWETGKAYVVDSDKGETIKKDVANEFINHGWRPYVIIDLPRTAKWTNELYYAIEKIKDGLLKDPRYQSKTVNIHGVKVMVMCNSMPKLDKLSADRWKVFSGAGVPPNPPAKQTAGGLSRST